MLNLLRSSFIFLNCYKFGEIRGDNSPYIAIDVR